MIFNLLDNQHQDTPTFLIQRFFRLFPLYLTVLLASAATQQWQVDTVADLPWRNEAIDNDLEIHAAALAHLPAQLAAHLTMLHGLVPGFLLPLSDYTLLGQAWSISVEWQFYLVAPLLFAMGTRRPLALGLLLLAIAAVRGRSWLGEGFAINQAGYFLIGTLSYVVWRRLRTLTGLESRRVWLGGIAAMTLVYCLLPRSVSLVIWILTLTVVIDAHCARDGIARRPAAVLRTRPPQWLGRVSSWVYLTHMLVLVRRICAAAAHAAGPARGGSSHGAGTTVAVDGGRDARPVLGHLRHDRKARHRTRPPHRTGLAGGVGLAGLTAMAGLRRR